MIGSPRTQPGTRTQHGASATSFPAASSSTHGSLFGGTSTVRGQASRPRRRERNGPPRATNQSNTGSSYGAEGSQRPIARIREDQPQRMSESDRTPSRLAAGPSSAGPSSQHTQERRRNGSQQSPPTDPSVLDLPSGLQIPYDKSTATVSLKTRQFSVGGGEGLPELKAAWYNHQVDGPRLLVINGERVALEDWLWVSKTHPEIIPQSKWEELKNSWFDWMVCTLSI